MNGEELGRSVTQAVRFLSLFYQDVALMLSALDRLMAERGWEPTEKTRCSDWLSNGIKSERWVLKEQFRCYVRPSVHKTFQDLVAFAILYDPRALFDFPVLLVAAACFASAVASEVIPNHWHPKEPLLKALAAKPAQHLLSAEQVASFLPKANRVSAFVVPLCDLTGAEALENRCIGPILALEAEQRRQESEERRLADDQRRIAMEQRRQQGEEELTQAHRQALDSSNGTQTAQTAKVNELCGEYRITQERAAEILNEAWKDWQRDRKPQ
jgi:hypothetical protein